MNGSGPPAPAPAPSPSHAPVLRGRRGALVAVLTGLVPALVALVVLGAPAPAASAQATNTQATNTQAGLPGEDRPAVTWGVRPSGPDGPDGRNTFDYTLEPGAGIEDYVGVSNYTDEPLDLAVYASDALTTQEGGFDLLPAATRPVDVGSWIDFASPTVTVPPRSRLEVPFRLTIPTDATPGDHTGGIVASLTTPGSAGEGRQFAVDSRVGARIHLRVPGEVVPRLTVTDVAVTYHGDPNPIGRGDATISYTVTNTGNVRVAARPAVEVSGPFGLGAAATTAERIDQLLPGSGLTLTTTVDDVAPLGRLRATVRVTPEPIGPPDTTAAPVAAGTASTWSVPWALLALLALAGLVAAGRHRRGTHRRRRLDTQLAAARAEGRDEALGSGAGGPQPSRFIPSATGI